MQLVQRRWLEITVKLVHPTLLGSLQEVRLSPPFAVWADIFNPSFDFSSTPKGCSKRHSCLLVWTEMSCYHTVLNSPSLCLCFIIILSTPWHLWVPLLICIWWSLLLRWKDSNIWPCFVYYCRLTYVYVGLYLSPDVPWNRVRNQYLLNEPMSEWVNEWVSKWGREWLFWWDQANEVIYSMCVSTLLDHHCLGRPT